MSEEALKKYFELLDKMDKILFSLLSVAKLLRPDDLGVADKNPKDCLSTYSDNT